MQSLHSPDFFRNKLAVYAAGFMCLLVYAGCLFFPLMDKDAAHHANIALHMYEHNDFINLVDRGNDYLDKPHLLFWVSAISFEIFGVNTFAHRFPALLFSLLSLYSTFRLARHLSNTSTAWMAVLMLATAESFMLSIIDARMEAPLTAFIIFGLWQMIMYVDKRNFIHLVVGAFGTACAFSTKGWLGPVIIFVALFFYILFSRKWKIILQPRTWLFVPLFFLFISPVLYAYYVQYDLHPEKIIRGKSGRSGIHFILWDQLFERAGGFDVKERNGDYFFLYHTFLWAFFPWSFAAYAGLVFWIRRLFVKRRANAFSFAAAAFAFTLFAISFSKFKMPHYIIMLLPLAALFTAPYLRIILATGTGKKWLYPLHMFFAVIVLLMTLALNFYFFHPNGIPGWIISLLVVFAFLYMLLKKRSDRGITVFWISVALSIFFNFFLNYNFFPHLMKYQGGNELVHLINEKKLNIPDNQVMLLELNAHSFDFYRKHNHLALEADQFAKQYPLVKDKYFLVSGFIRDYLEKEGFIVQTVIGHTDYNVATVKLNFLNPATREKTLDSLMLVKIYAGPAAKE